MAAGLGSAPSIIVGVGVGAAASAALQPALEIPRQEAWKRNRNRVLNPELLARLVAQGGVSLDAARGEAARDGYASDKLDALVYLAQTVPPVAEALTLWRRGLLSDALWRHVLVRVGFDERYVAGLTELKESEPLSPQDLAYAVVRGLVPDENILPVPPPTQGGKVPRFAVTPLSPTAEAARSGMNAERFRVLVGRSGLSMAPVMAAQAFFRGVIERVDYDIAIAEGDLRNEWRDAILGASRAILSPHEYAELELRGWINQAQRDAGAARHGMEPAEAQLLFDMTGRPIPVHQVTTGEARGGEFNGDHGHIPAPFLRSLEESNVRPEWYSLAYANRYSYPSAFVLRTLVQTHELTEAEGKQTLLDIGWNPTLATKVAARWAGGTAAAGDPHVTKAEMQLWATLHRSYLDEETDEAQARVLLGVLGVAAGSEPKVLGLWNHERDLRRRTLTEAQIKKAWKDTKFNRATAIARLEALGLSAADAATLLDE